MIFISKCCNLKRFSFSRSAKVVELSKVIPTLSGAPLNMTVLLTASMGLEVTAKADLSQYIRGTGPVQAKGGMSLGYILKFRLLAYLIFFFNLQKQLKK